MKNQSTLARSRIVLVGRPERQGQVLVAALAGLALGCSKAVPVERTCVAGSAIVGGTAKESFLSLGDDAEQAIVKLDFTVAGEPKAQFCSGVIIGPGVVLSAAHCARVPGAGAVSAHFGGAGSPVSATGTVTATHPTLDLMVVSFDPQSTVNLPFLRPAGRMVTPGDLVELAGAGLDRNGSAGTVRFAVEEVVEANGQFITVRGDGTSGACFGDSGGPLLVRDADGRPAVAGVLSEGSRSCVGLDRYTRLTGAMDWLAPYLKPPSGTGGCGRISAMGRCFDGVAVWCEHGELAAAACDPEACGWSDRAAGWRCIERRADPCSGVTELGECVGDLAVRCSAGRLTLASCDVCGAVCQRVAASGIVACVVPSLPAAGADGGDGFDASTADDVAVSEDATTDEATAADDAMPSEDATTPDDAWVFEEASSSDYATTPDDAGAIDQDATGGIDVGGGADATDAGARDGEGEDGPLQAIDGATTDG